MKTYKWIVLFVVLLIVTVGIYAWSLYAQIKKLKFRILDVKLSKPINTQELNVFSALQLLNLEVIVMAEMQNYSSRDFKINSFYAELQDDKGRLLSKQVAPITDIIAKAGKTETLQIPFVVKVANLAESLFENADISTILNLIQVLNGNGSLNRNLVVKGFVRVQNIPFAYPINETVKV